MGSNKNKKKSSDGGDLNNKKVINDPRFSKVHHDPRFQNLPRNKAKVKIDSRFRSVLTDKKFATSSSTRVDKRGKLKVQAENELQRHYHFDDDDDDDDDKVTVTKPRKLSKIKRVEEVEIDDDDEKSEDLVESESNDDDDDDTDDTDVEDDVEGATSSDDDVSAEVENIPLIEKETHRLAVVNMDWTQVKAVDIFVMLSSCLPKEGHIKSVSVYPSEFGLQRMEEEAIRGPVALFEDDKKKNEGNSDDDDESDEEGDDDEVSGNEEDADEVSDNEDVDEISENENEDENLEHEGSDSEDGYGDGLEDNNDDEIEDDDDDDEDDDEIDTEKLRAYEKSRLRYYYAVVECDSVATADYLYKTCDGIEFERSSNVMDLRFIPDSMEFKHPARDVATEAPADYVGLDFHTRALQHTNTILSWDDDEPHRVKTLRRNYTDEQLAELELSEFLASGESESDEDENGDENPSERRKKKAEKYRALVQSGDGGSEEEDEAQNMEVTFATGLEDISKKIIEKKEKESETVFEASQRKQKEKRLARKNKPKTLSDDDDSDKSDDQDHGEDQDDFFEETLSVRKGKKDRKGKKKREEKPVQEKATEASTAELELLLADEDGENKKPKGYNIKRKKSKGKKGDDTAEDLKLPTVDVDDPRFSALFINPLFSLDPTDPQFKRSAAYVRQMAQKQKKGSKEEHGDVEPTEPSNRKKDDHSGGISQKHELSAVVKSLKMKTQQKRKDEIDSGRPISGKKHKLPSSNRTSKKAKSQK